jgi:carboxyl-terminal processing protease
MQIIDEAIKRIEQDYITPVSRRTLTQACLTSLKQPAPETDDPIATRAAITEALQRAQAGDISHPSAAEECLRGMMTSLNQHSRYMGPLEFKELRVGTADLAAIGLELAAADEGARVVGVLEGGPGARARIKSGTILTRIDDRDLRGMRLSDITRMLRGEVGSTVQITLRPADQAEPYTLALQRELLRLKSIQMRLLEPGLAFVRITQFNESVPQNMAEGLAELQSEHGAPLEGIILDLRACSGGLLNVSVAISAAFLRPRELIVYTAGRTSDSSMRLYSSPEYYMRSGHADPYIRLPAEAKSAPMLVLVSKTTAAGAEAVAAALQDHKRATIVGARTFGKGFVETIFPLKSDSALKLTTASMFRPSGKELQDNGVTPDVMIDQPVASDSAIPASNLAFMTAEAQPDPVLDQAVTILKARQ